MSAQEGLVIATMRAAVEAVEVLGADARPSDVTRRVPGCTEYDATEALAWAAKRRCASATRQVERK